MKDNIDKPSLSAACLRAALVGIIFTLSLIGIGYLSAHGQEVDNYCNNFLKP
jgi:hypothetical protein